MDLSVVIPCKNGAGAIGEQLAALSRQHWNRPWEVIVADNGSTDGTAAVVLKHKKHLPQLRWLDASRRPGAAHARNAGVAAAGGQAIAFCDADDEVGTDWLAAMGNGLKHHDFVAARLDIEKLNLPEITSNLNHPQRDGLQTVAYPPHLPHASGTSLGVRRELHHAVGGFDEDLPYLEDTDYCFRLQLRGIKLHFLAEAVVHYRFKDRPQELFRQARHWGQYNVLMYKRYREHMRLEHPWKRHLSLWRSLIRRSPCLLEKEQRPAWVKTLGTQVGLLQGSIKYRVPPVAMWLMFLLAEWPLGSDPRLASLMP
jgi:glycosyltransferase involved in cell wall biosynthesis